MDKLPINRCRISANSRTVSSKTVIPSVRPCFESSCFTDNIPHLWTTQFAECKGLSHLQGLQLILYQQPRARMIEDGSKFKLWVFDTMKLLVHACSTNSKNIHDKVVFGSSDFSKYNQHQLGITCILWYSMAWPMSFGSSKRQKWVLGRCSSSDFADTCQPKKCWECSTVQVNDTMHEFVVGSWEFDKRYQKQVKYSDFSLLEF